MAENGCTEEQCYCIMKYISIIIGIVFTILCIIYNSLAFTYKPYNDEYYIEIINNWKLTPISSISINTDILNNEIELDSSIENKILILNRLKPKYDYEYLYLNNDTKHHPCGTDDMNNYLYLPNDMQCPINYIKLTNKEIPEDNVHNFTIIQIQDNLYLHYSNNFIENSLINDVSIKISDYDIINLNKGEYYGLSRDLTEKYYYIAIFHSKKIRIAINIITLIFLIIVIINFIITLKIENSHALHLLNILILVTNILLESIINVYFDKNKFFDIGEKLDKKAEYNNYLFKFFCVLSAVYLVLVTILHPKANFYYYLIYPFRFGYNWMNFKINEEEEEKNQNDKEIERLNKEIEKYNNEINELEKIREQIMEQIREKNDELNNENKKKENLKVITDKIKSEKEYLDNIKKEDYIEYKKILMERKNIEKKINYYKFISFKQKINNNEGL